MAESVIILGTGGNSVDILETLHDINQAAGETLYTCKGFLDDREALQGTETHGHRVLGPIQSAPEHPACRFVNGIGSPKSYRDKPGIIAQAGLEDSAFVTLIHPTAYVSRSARLGPGTVILQQATVTSNVVIGNHVIVLPNSVVSHDVRVGDYTSIAGGVMISSGVVIGPGCYLGTGSCIRGDLRIDEGALVGMGSVVLDHVAAGDTVLGNPARPKDHA